MYWIAVCHEETHKCPRITSLKIEPRTFRSCGKRLATEPLNRHPISHSNLTTTSLYGTFNLVKSVMDINYTLKESPKVRFI